MFCFAYHFLFFSMSKVSSEEPMGFAGVNHFKLFSLNVE